MSTLRTLRLARTLHDVAAILGYQPSALSYILYRAPKAARYTTFSIPKKGGGERRIDAPFPKLKLLQKRLATVLYDCLKEIEDLNERKNRASHAFRRGYSIISNAKAHKARRFVLNIDLQDFFPSFNFGRVRGFFMKNNNFKLAEPVATILAQIACNDGKLPQGSPCSPVLSELLTHFLDIRLINLAARNKCSYTRYADDITFSTNQKVFPTALAVPAGEGWLLGTELRERIVDSGFLINDSKTRMQQRGSRQIVTGLTVNTKVNVPRSYYKLARAMTHSFLSTGKYFINGEESTSVHALEGILNHIYHIRERQVDLTIDAITDPDKKKKLHRQRVEVKNEWPSAIRLNYFRLVFYKHFIDPVKPLVLCEGKTDPIYLKCAIRRLGLTHPKLASVKDGKISPDVAFFKYSKQAGDLLQLRGGVSDIKFFLEAWKTTLARFKHRPMKHPIIVLIDNDDGAKEIFGLLKGKFGIEIKYEFDNPFYHLGGPLYLIKTPALGAKHTSRIEDFFASHILETLLDGKKLNLDKKHQALGEYGKAAFAEGVVRPQAASIDFTGFAALLKRIEEAIYDYSKRTPASGLPIPAASAGELVAAAVAMPSSADKL